jgi:hypothetical protein
VCELLLHIAIPGNLVQARFYSYSQTMESRFGF